MTPYPVWITARGPSLAPPEVAPWTGSRPGIEELFMRWIGRTTQRVDLMRAWSRLVCQRDGHFDVVLTLGHV